MKIYVIGHKPSDLDSVASAVEYTEFLQRSNKYKDSELVAAVAGPPNKETQFVFQKFNVDLPVNIDDVTIGPDDHFILVDHNEFDQRSEKVDNEKILGIVDHHKMKVDFKRAIKIDLRPLGSTSTIIYEEFESAGIKPTNKTLALILSSILSDCVGLKSSLTTGLDSEIANKIAKELYIDLEKLTFEIFKAKSDIEGLSPEQIVKKDFKIFDFGGKKVFIGQAETVESEALLNQKDVLINALKEVKSKEDVQYGFLFITDILKINSQALYTNEDEKKVLEQAFTTQGHDRIADVGPRMSRKKDLAPEIEKIITSK
ncbi:hypothetical protein A3F07_03365 [candidate division WWE3 bacterium RIFCSPHIGHO2_12_FULL_38_15]|uniref:inorganic diphosphatase n=1 Tax=candidate division WWE3 bacterium RIFCSPHIGHO2_02_FULL_38_14 TaxID=1802620 RepID=A0A1F4V6H1_UNCKA|nr:MAG: hypothetical protein A2793_03020 [candidate division WWE3 bacterium RIFCSPHIGHO2_01_FULL_38_45]OGC48841.1 MAG: hypothetical protein A3F07_03365 [candidate division WWE3 bacterium RIFCSPHIGHO2_12_FULL_38_15]OGC52797.1 MAG: hypothetical protein A3D91_02055 [candidate division WWE3 bacterium RIFCSPHIGHO2_02_FULL_38_14]OGC53144.1 MAG: hypothetical protein A3B64_01705 [candidate division WWE3 bacterium RIFCSPLOWO2_01_FULL_37_24]HLB51983.1 DHHA2 domain-containing protein [Patescibacteria grou